MSFELIEFGKNIGASIVEGCTMNFFKGAVDVIEDKRTKEQASKKALEGEKSDIIKSKVDILMNEYCAELKKVTAYYTESELREMFNRYYQEYLHKGQKFPDDDKEALYKRYKIFVESYITKLSKTISFGEKRILDKEDQLLKAVEKVNDKTLSSKDFQKIAEKQSELLNKLCEDIDIPFVEICSSYAEVNYYDSKYVFLGNIFDFEKDKNRDDTYIVSLQVKNIGKTPVNEICISNFKLLFCKEENEDNSENGYLVLKAIEHNNIEKCTINILPGSEQKLHFLVRRRPDELNGENVTEYFINGDSRTCQLPFDYDRLFIEFDMNVTGKVKTKKYHLYIFLSRGDAYSYSDINGKYSVDYVGAEMIDANGK